MLETILIVAVISVIVIAIGGAITFMLWRKKQQDQLLQTTTSKCRGTQSERNLVLQLLKSGTSNDAMFHDLFVQKTDGGYSQIDLVILTNAGIIVIEDKCYSGWIFGNANNDDWTQVLKYGDIKHKFYNPIKQNAWHITHLQRILNEPVPYYSIIVFSGECTLKDISNIPNKTFVIYPHHLWQLVNDIATGQPVNYRNKRNVHDVLKKGVDNGFNPTIKQRHGDDIQRKFKRY